MPSNNTIYLYFWGVEEPLLLELEANQRKSSSCLLLLEGTTSPPPRRSSGTSSSPECTRVERLMKQSGMPYLVHFTSILYVIWTRTYILLETYVSLNIVIIEMTYVTYWRQKVCNVTKENHISCSAIFWFQGGGKTPCPFNSGTPDCSGQ